MTRRAVVERCGICGRPKDAPEHGEPFGLDATGAANGHHVFCAPATDCTCEAIMRADATRHFKECPLRERHPVPATGPEAIAQSDPAAKAASVILRELGNVGIAATLRYDASPIGLAREATWTIHATMKGHQTVAACFTERDAAVDGDWMRFAYNTVQWLQHAVRKMPLPAPSPSGSGALLVPAEERINRTLRLLEVVDSRSMALECLGALTALDVHEMLESVKKALAHG